MTMATKRKYKVKRYNGEFGSEVDPQDGSGEVGAAQGKSSDSDGPVAAAPAPEKKLTFKEAFSSARKAGDKTFEWQGKKYTTAMASSTKGTATSPERKDPLRSKPVYETPYDRMNRQTREADLAAKSSRDSERATLRENLRARISGSAPSKTSTAMKSGGMTASRRADGIAQRGKTRGRMV